MSLGYDGGVVIGRAERPAGEAQIPVAAAEAALDAVRQLAPAPTRWVLGQIAIQPMLAGQAVVASVVLETEGSTEHLIGSALSRSGPIEEAAAEAVLDAVERRLGRFIRR
ncbi:MAG TPA: hypothetical protein VFH63_08050 [candidate division Zixibacteria bacterium]|nr:hypothetical protein [candidate division Zixibacteria bacterium]